MVGRRSYLDKRPDMIKGQICSETLMHKSFEILYWDMHNIEQIVFRSAIQFENRLYRPSYGDHLPYSVTLIQSSFRHEAVSLDG